MSNKKVETEKCEEKKGFFERIREDKQYKAKVELIGYGVFIVILVVYLNIANMMSGSSVTGNVLSDGRLEGDVLENDKDLEVSDSNDAFSKLKNNYQYEVSVTKKSLVGVEEVLVENRYSGKQYKDTLEIVKTSGGESRTFYKVGVGYYVFREGVVPSDLYSRDSFSEVLEDEIYVDIESKYVEYSEVLKLISLSSLDHVTNYSSGKKEYVYHLSIRDVVLNYQESDFITFSVLVENDVISMEADYTKLLKLDDKDLSLCKVVYTYKEIGKVEEFMKIVD